MIMRGTVTDDSGKEYTNTETIELIKWRQPVERLDRRGGDWDESIGLYRHTNLAYKGKETWDALLTCHVEEW